MAVSSLLAAPLRRFAHLDERGRELTFVQPPGPLRASTDARSVGIALGAVVYTPATRAGVVERLLGGHWPAVTAMVFCLEDSIGDDDVASAGERLINVLRFVERHVEREGARDGLPYIFVRPRTVGHLEDMLEDWRHLAAHVDGIALPKIGVEDARRYFALLVDAQAGRDRPLWGMPIIEGRDVAMREERLPALLQLRALLADHREIVPCVRLGATDLSGIWGLRRPRDFTVYEIAVVRDIIADVVNVFGRDADGPVISGPAWEYIRDPPVFKPPLREAPFSAELGPDAGPALRRQIVSSAFDGLLRETFLDKANGLHGKTVVHPSHALVVDASYVVTYEEWMSAKAIRRESGVICASVNGQMNEPKPHRRWAERTLRRAAAFGVLRPEHTFHALLEGQELG